MTELEFLKRWILALDRIDSSVRGRVNSVSIALSGKFIGVDSYGKVSVDLVDNQSGLFMTTRPEESDPV